MILSMTFIIILAGVAVTAWGQYVPFMIASSIVMAIGAGLLTTFKPDTGSPAWIGYQFIFGVGVGLGMQQTPIVIQACLPENDMSVAVAFILFCQMFGGALSVSIAQNIITNDLVKSIKIILPNEDPKFILAVGATELRKVVPQGAIFDRIIEAYNHALTRAFFVSVATSILSFFGACVLEWKNIKTANPNGLPEKEKEKTLEEEKARPAE